MQGSENGVQQTTVDPKESDDDSDNDTGDTQPDARTQSDPRTTAPALPAAPRTIMLSSEKIKPNTKSATMVWELLLSWEVATIQSEREM